MPDDGPLSVLLLAPESTGGIGQHIRTLAAGLVARGVSVTVCAPPGTLDRFDIAGTGARSVEAPVGAVKGWARARARVAALASGHDITHAHGVRAAAMGMTLAPWLSPHRPTRFGLTSARPRSNRTQARASSARSWRPARVQSPVDAPHPLLS